ncbi:hypothetical protein ACA910_010015 [Epithemia clementina (nom. ined.)]
MGNVKVIYMQYALTGDEFVGRCLCLLPLLQAEFGVSPSHFADWVGDDVQEKLTVTQFPMIHQIDGFGKLCRMCVACIVFYLNYLIGLPINHLVCIASLVLQQQITLEYFQT